GPNPNGRWTDGQRHVWDDQPILEPLAQWHLPHKPVAIPLATRGEPTITQQQCPRPQLWHHHTAGRSSRRRLKRTVHARFRLVNRRMTAGRDPKDNRSKGLASARSAEERNAHTQPTYALTPKSVPHWV